MSVTPNYVPREYKTITVNLVVPDAERAIKFYNSAFGAELTMKLVDPDGLVVHAEMKIEDTIIMLSEDKDVVPGNHVVIQIYTGDVEGLFEAAIMSGAREIFPVKEQFYGDRAGRVMDPFGFQWIIATHVEDVPPRELYKRFNELYT